MFDIGGVYTFTMWLSAAQGTETFVAEVVEIAMPLIIVERPGATRMVINTSSPHFAKAEVFQAGTLMAQP